MTSYSFEPVSIPRADELRPIDEVDDQATAEGHVVSEPVDASALEGEESHLPEFGRTAPEGAVPDARSSRPSSGPSLDDQLEAAREEAHRQGVDEGRRAEAERLRTALGAVRSLVDEIHRADETRQKEAVDRIAALATAIAAHLLEREVRTSSDIVSDLVRRAIAEFPVSEALNVHLNPADLTLLSSGIGGGSPQPLTSGHTARWVPDPQIRPGGCLVEGGDRVVDARLTTVLERVFKALVDG